MRVIHKILPVLTQIIKPTACMIILRPIQTSEVFHQLAEHSYFLDFSLLVEALDAVVERGASGSFVLFIYVFHELVILRSDDLRCLVHLGLVEKSLANVLSQVTQPFRKLRQVLDLSCILVVKNL